MTTTKTILNLDVTNYELTTYCPADKSDYVLVDTTVNSDGSREALYQKVTDADIPHPATVRVGYYPSKAKDRVNVSVKFSTWLKTVVDSPAQETYDEVTCVLAFSGPFPAGGIDHTNFIHVLANTFSWFLPQGGTGPYAFATTAMDKLKFGVVNDLNTLHD